MCEMPRKTEGQNTDAAVVWALTDEAGRTGETVERPVHGLRVVMDRRTLAEKAARSRATVSKSVARLEESRALVVDAGGAAHKPGAFILPVSSGGASRVVHSGEIGGARGKVSEGEGKVFTLSKAPSDPGGLPYSLHDKVPTLRAPRLLLYKARKDGREVVADYHYVWRLGEKRAAILRHVLEAGGEVTEAELMERFAGARTRPRDFRR